ncbi:MAG TPA: MG2 domain-containing protein [Thermoanaerobaculia bacterium]|nr:MG2 domain-containing protein [Thermoanaerobaculia bacterium]
MKRWVLTILLLLSTNILYADATLRVISAGPVGEVASYAEANEVRVVFSEPMVVLGRIPPTVTAPFFHISPQVNGTFRWSGTTTLIFKPEPLPFARKFDVTIDQTATSVAGTTLDRAYTFSFTTPTVKLLNTNFYRKPNGAVVIGLRFNQPVDSAAALQHLQLRTQAHVFEAPAIPTEGVERLKAKEPQALEAFREKAAKYAQIAASNGEPVFVFETKAWDEKQLGKPSKDLMVIETKPGVEPETHLRLTLDEKLALTSQSAPTGKVQKFVIALEPALFVKGLRCSTQCDPDWGNFIRFRADESLSIDAVRKAVTVTDVTDPAKEVVLEQQHVDREFDSLSSTYTFDDFGYTLQPEHRYVVRVDPSLKSEAGQTLGYTWMGSVELWHRSAFISFGDGQGVWESSGGSVLPFHSRNFRSVTQWIAPLTIEQMMPTLQKLRQNNFVLAPDAPPQQRKLNPTADKIQSFGLNMKPVIGGGQAPSPVRTGEAPVLRGLVWAAMKPGAAIEKAAVYDPSTKATVVQVTNLGITVKDSPQNVLVVVTALDTAKPVAGATVSIRDFANKVLWSGTTDARGIVTADVKDVRAIGTGRDTWSVIQDLRFIVVAEKDGDVAYVGADWNEGVQPWDFSLRFDLNESRPMLRGTVFSDRGVYKLGEDVHFKAIVRSDTPNGMKLLPVGTNVDVKVIDAHGKEAGKRTLPLSEWSSAEWVFTIPPESPLGPYSVVATVNGQSLQVGGGFLVAAYRRPDFRVDTTLTAPSSIAGTDLEGTIRATYLHGGPMAGRPVNWTYSKMRVYDVPSAIRDRFPETRFAFLGWNWWEAAGEEDGERPDNGKKKISTATDTLHSNGELPLTLPTDLKAGWPMEYTLEGDVTDVTRQHIAGRASFVVDPAPWYIGIKPPQYFADAAKGIDTEVVAASIRGTATAGVRVKVELKRIQWNSVRRAAGNGFYEWDTERKEVAAGEWTVETQSQPVPLHVPMTAGGQYRLIATASDGEGRSTQTRVDFYAIGNGYTAWQRYDHNRIDLVPEKMTYRPGETARIMVKSPWEHATALVTTEREGVRTSHPFELTSTQQTIEVPVTEDDIPNFFVSVVLVKGRTKEAVTEDASDPGKPAFRLGYTELTVVDDAKRLKVAVKANRDEYRPASKANIEVDVRDAAGKAAQSEVTLWAVDYGVLSLTAYQTPDVLESIYLRKALQVLTEDSRQRIVSRRVLTPKGAGEGGGGGRENGVNMVRKDFRVLAFWLGSITTDANGHAHTQVTLPESLTTYRIMVVAGDRASRFGWAQSEIKVNKPLMITAAFPRFMAMGDKAYFGGAVNSQKISGRATVTIRSLDPAIVDFTGATKSTIGIKPNSATEVRFDAVAKSIGNARVQMTVKLGRESDAFEDIIPVRVLVSPETVAAYGEAKPQAKETLQIPPRVVPTFGGLHMELSSTAMTGLAEGAEYLVDYPYGCAEQRASSALALVLTSDLGEAFHLPGIDATKGKSTAQATLRELYKFQCGDGGFAYWPGECVTESPYLTAWVLHVYQRAQKLGYDVDKDVLSRAYTYLDNDLTRAPHPDNEGWWPAYTAWQAFAVKTLAEGGRNVDTHVNRLYGFVDRMPVFGLSHLADAMIAKGEKGPRVDELHRRMLNAVLPEGGQAHVGELADPYLLWFWNSNVRSTAIVMQSLVRQNRDEEIVKRMVRWLMVVRKKGRWGNTQENAWAMEALVDYYTKYESEVPNFATTAAIGAQTIARGEFRGRSTEAKTTDMPMREVLSLGAAGTQLPIVFNREGTGTLFYLLRLRYASTDMKLQPLDAGFALDRTYRLHGDKAAATSFNAGDLIEVTLKVSNTKERRFVAITDPIPAGTEPVETAFATTASDVSDEQQQNDYTSSWAWWERGGFDHVERHDDRVNVFAMRLGEGQHEYKYLVRATTAGTFIAAPTHAEEMYEPEVFGRTATSVVEVKK